MSGIAGIYNLDGRPADASLLRRMTDAIAHRGRDGAGHWVRGPVALGHRMLHTTPESLLEDQPLTDESGTLCLTLDGRVDNRDELRAALKVKGARLRDSTDAELVLRAYECWGEECPAKIIGDFAFVIWDGRKRQLFSARDHLGIRPFYYYADDKRFLFGSELQQILKEEAVPRECNEEAVGKHLVGWSFGDEMTLFQSIRRLPPCHCLAVSPDGLRRSRYWDANPAYEVRYRTDAEYAEHFLEIFREAVRCRLRSQGPVGIALSGGVDSSSIAMLTQSLQTEGCLSHGAETFSLIFPGLSCDEREYIEEVTHQSGLLSNLVSPTEGDALSYGEQACRYRDIPDYPNSFMWHSVMNRLRNKGFRVLLVGLGGDEWFTGCYNHYADSLRRFQLWILLRQVYYDARLSGVAIHFPRLRVLRLGLWPLLPSTVRRRIKKCLGVDTPRWIPQRFALRIGLGQQPEPTVPGPDMSFAQKELLNRLHGTRVTHFLEMHTRLVDWHGVEHRYPYHDRRMIEFALALPDEQLWRRDQTKFVLREAMRGYLPETIRQRRTKAEFSDIMAKAILTHARLFDSLEIASLGWVDGKQIRKMFQKMARLYADGDLEYIEYEWPVWRTIGLEIWYREVVQKEGSLPAGEPAVDHMSA